MSSPQPETVAPHALPTLPSLTSLRWFAASAVFLHHATGLLTGRSTIASAVYQVAPQGPSGVSFFFVLSGFVLGWSHRPGDRPRAFWRRRVARIGPAYWLTCVIGFGVTAWLGGQLSAIGLLTSLLLVQAWSTDSSIYYFANGVNWSLSAEAFFYLSFPLLALGLASRTPRQLKSITLGLAVVSCAVPLALRPTASSELEHWGLFIFPLYRALEFAIGVGLAFLLRAGCRVPVSRSAALAIAAGAFLVSGHVPSYAMWVATTLIPYALLIFACAQADLDGRPSWLHRSALVTLGAWSFGFYLLHQLVLKLAAEELHPPTVVGQLALLVACYSTSIGLSAALYKGVESPLERRLRPRRVERRLAQPPQARA